MRKSLAIVGCGAVAETFYLPALQALDPREWEVLCVDTDGNAASALSRALPALGRVSSLTQSSRIDAAIVATPPHTHLAIVRQLLERGCHVLCEKPLATSATDAEQMVSLASARGVSLTVNQTRRFYPSTQLARTIVASGELGRVRRVEAREGVKFSWPARTTFLFDPSLRRNGIVSDQGAHLFDQLNWILGDDLVPRTVVTDGYKGPEATACIDFTAGTIRGTALMTWLMTLPSSTEFVCDRGTLVLDSNWNRATIVAGGKRRVIWGRKTVRTYQDLGRMVLKDLLGVCEGLPSRATAASVAPSIRFLDHAYEIAQACWPRESMSS